MPKRRWQIDALASHDWRATVSNAGLLPHLPQQPDRLFQQIGVGGDGGGYRGQVRRDRSFNADRNSSLLEIELASVWERLFDDNEGSRWNDTFWTHLFGANARAFQHVTNAGQKLFWGYNGPSNGSGGSSYGGSGSIGGGGSIADYQAL